MGEGEVGKKVWSQSGDHEHQSPVKIKAQQRLMQET